MSDDIKATDDFIMLPAVSGGAALVRRSQIAGGRANGRDGAIVYLASGPSVYTTASVPELARYLKAETAELRSD